MWMCMQIIQSRVVGEYNESVHLYEPYFVLDRSVFVQSSVYMHSSNYCAVVSIWTFLKLTTLFWGGIYLIILA